MVKLKPDCLTYFYVVFTPKFKLRDFCQYFNLSYEEALEWGDDEGLIIGWNNEYDIDINVMVRKSLGLFMEKAKELANLKGEYGLEYYLERVPSLVSDATQNRQNLSLAADVIRFLADSGAVDELDYFVL